MLWSTFRTDVDTLKITEIVKQDNMLTLFKAFLLMNAALDVSPIEAFVYIDPSVISNTFLTEVSTSAALIQWSPPLSPVTSYLVSVVGVPSSEQNVTSEIFNLKNLIPGNYYTVFISANGAFGNISFNTEPGEVKNLIVLYSTTSSVSLSWESPEGNTSFYLIQIQGSSTFNTTATSTSVRIEDLTPGNYYTFLVSALVGENNIQGKSKEISGYTNPLEVKNLSVDQTTTTSVSLKWEPPEGNTSSYLIQIQGNSTFNTSVTSTSVTIEDLTPGNYYTFLVSALVGEINVQGNSTDVSAYTKPGEVKNLSVVHTTTSSVSLIWESPEGNSSSYLVQIQGNSTFNNTVTSTSVTIEDLIAGNYYTFLVSALVGETNIQGNSTDISDYTIPGEVRNITPVTITTTSVFLIWQPPEGNVDSYVIEIIEIPDFNKTASSPSITITDLIPGNYYTFLVTAQLLDKLGKSVPVSEYTRPANVTIVDVSKVNSSSLNVSWLLSEGPGEVKNLSVFNITTSSVSLSWEPPEGNTSSYLIQILGNSAFNTTATSTSVTIEDLTPGNYYTFLVSALVGENNIQGNSTDISAYTKPGEVKNLTVLQTTTSSVSLIWESPEGSTSSYLIQIQGNSTFNKTVTSASVTIEDLTPGNYYTFLVSALVGENNVQGRSIDVSAYTNPGEVKNLSVDQTTTTSVSLKWEPPEGNTSSYLIQIQGNSTFNTSVTSTSVTIEDLTPGNYYTFLVSALVGENNIQGNSTDLSAYTKPGEVKNLTVLQTTTSSVSLIWESPEGSTSSYLIQIQGNSTFNKTVTSASVTIEDLTPGNYYTFLVSALVGENNVQGRSIDVSAYTNPGEVKNLSVDQTTTTSVSLKWEPPEGNTSSYLIQIQGNSTFNTSVTSTSVTIEDLTPGNYYTFLVSALVGENNIQGNSTDISAYTKPGEVKNLTVLQTTTSSVSLIWESPEGSTSSYLIQIQGNSTFNKTVTSASVTIEDLTPGNYYTFLVSALVGENNVQGRSIDVSAYTNPGEVKNLSVDQTTTTSVSLKWEPPEGNTSSYLIQIQGNSTFNTSVTSTSVTIEDLTLGNYYTFLVSALVGENNIQGNSTDISAYTKPGEVKNLTVLQTTTSSVSLIWESPEGSTSSYLIQIQGNSTFNKTVTSASVTIEDLTPGNYYTFLVSALVGENNVQGRSIDVSAYTNPGEVKNLSVDQTTTTSVSLKWEPPEGNTSSYLIQIQGNSTFNTSVTSTSVTIEDLTPGNYYTFLVSALVGENNIQGNSTDISAYTKPGEVKNLTVLQTTTSSVSLIWESPEGSTSSYLIQIQGNSTFNKTVTSASVTIEDLTPGNYYTFLVSALVGENNVQGRSIDVSAYTKPGEVKNLSVVHTTTSSVSLSWESPEGNTSSYLVQIQGNSTFNNTVTSTSITIEDLTPGNYYTFLVSALVGETNIQGKSKDISDYTKPGEVKNLRVVQTTTSSAFLKWESPEGNTSSYLVQIQGNSTFNKTAISTSVTIEDLTPGNYYTFLVSALVGENNVQGRSIDVSVFTNPGEVKNLSVHQTTTTSVSLRWEPPEGDTSSYLIQIQGNSTFNTSVTSTSVTIEDLTPGNYYTFLVSALVGEINVQGNSTDVSAYTNPGEVKNLSVDQTTTTSVSLKWEPPEGDTSSYLIQIQGNSNFNASVTSTSVTIEDLTPGNYYTFLVSALVGENNVQGNSTDVSAYTKPGEVKNLSVVHTTTSSVSLSWESPEGNTSSYLVQIQGNYTFNNTVTSTSVTIEDLKPGNYYTFLVSALVGENNIQGNSTEISAYTKPGEVKNLRVVQTTTSSVFLKWEPPEGNTSFYLIQIRGNTIVNTTVISTSVTIEDLTPGNYYTFLVSALVGENNVQGRSIDVSAYTKPGEVKNLSVVNTTTSSVSLIWEPPEGNTSSYLVQIQGNSTFNTTVMSTFITIEDLTPGNYYTILVSALVGENNIQGNSTDISAYTKPGEVKNLSVVHTTTTSVSLIWEPPEGNTSSYLIQILGNSAFNTTVTSTSVTIEDLTPGNYYTFLVSAVVGENNIQGNSTDISAYTNLGEVKNLSVVHSTTTSVSLRWDPPEGNTNSYLIQIQGNSTFNTSVTSTSVIIEDLTPGNYYTFLVSAVVGENNIQGNSTDISAYTNPGEVKNLSVVRTTTTSVSLIWESPEGNANSYLVQIQGNLTFNNTVTSTSVTIEDLIPGNYYTFLVSALVGETNIQGNSTDISDYTIPGEVRNITPVTITTTSVFLIWQPPEGNVDSYVIEIIEIPDFNKTASSPSITITDLIPGNYYTFLVTAQLLDKLGKSVPVSAYTRPANVTIVDVSKVNSSSLNVSWLLSEGNTSSYLVEVLGDPPQSFNVYTKSVTITNLTSGNQYTVRISSVAGENDLRGSSSDVLVLLSEIISSTDISTTSIYLVWKPSPVQNYSYIISVYGSPSSNVTVNSTEALISNLVPGNIYRIQISAYSGNIFLNGYGDEITLYTRPGEVKNLSVFNITTSSVSLSWEPPEGNTSSYLIQILGNSAFNTTTTSTSVTIEDLTPGNYYTFLVSALVGENNIQGNSTDISAYTKPGEVKNLTVLQTTTSSVSLIWESPEGSTSSYLIQIQGNSTFNKTVTSASVTIEDLTPGNYYTFLVSALVGENNVQGRSIDVSAYTTQRINPGEVKNVSVDQTTATSVSLKWEPPEGDTSSYLIQIQGNSTFNTSVTSTSVTIEDLTPGNYYTFLVSALVGENNVQGNSTDVSAYTKPGEVKNLTVLQTTTSSVSLIWESPEGSTSSYLIQIQGNSTFNTTATSTSVTIEDLTPGNYYTFLVSALVGDNNIQGNSTEISAYTKPGEVKNLSVLQTTTSSVSLIWESPEGNTSSYLVQIQGNSTFNKTVTSASVTIEDLSPGNYYTFLVSALVDPGEVKNLSVDQTTTTSVSLKWEPPEGNTSSYLIQIQGNSTFNTSVTSTSVTIEDLTPGNYYTFLVSALVGENNVQGNSTDVSAYTKPGEVKNLRVVQTTTSSVFLKWEPPEGNTSSYLIQIQGNPIFNTTATSTSVTIEDLTPGNYYTFLVSALVDENNVQGRSIDVSAYTNPGEVKNLSVDQTTTTSVSLKWEPPEGNTSFYLIQIQGNSTFNTSVTSTSVTIEDLTPGNYYTFLVSALVGENNVQGNSTDVSAYTNPGEVKNLSVDQTTTTSVSLKWEPPEGNTSSYLIQIQGNSNFNASVTSTSVTIEDLTPGNYYTFLVSALVGENNVQGNSTDVSAYTKPGEVKNLSVVHTTTSSVSLSWESPEGNTSSYLVQIQGNYTFNNTVTSTSVTIEDLKPGNYYTFLVSALVGENNIQGNSTEISAYTKPGEVKNLRVVQTTTSSVFLKWEPPEGNTSSYLIQIQGNTIVNTTVISTSVTIEDLTPGNYYTFLVSALVGENNVQGNSTDVSGYTIPGEVRNITPVTITTTSVFLIWQPPEGNIDSYVIEIIEIPDFNKTASSPSITITDLIPGNYYTFLVTAQLLDKLGKSVPVSEYTRPANVTIVDVSKVNSSSLNVSWLLSEGNTSSYLVEVLGDPPQSFNVYTESVTITNLTSGNQYTVRISSVAGENDLRGSSSDVLVLLSEIISSTDISTTSIYLVWKPSPVQNYSYIISVYGSPSSNVTVNSTEALISNLVPGNIYRIQISAYSGNIFLNGYGDEITLYTRPGEVKNLSVFNITTSSVSLSWEPPEGNTSSYLIQILGNSAFNTTATSTSVTIEDLTPGNYYTFLVSALVGDNNIQGNSTDISAYTKPGEVKNLTVLQTTTSSVSLIWESPEGSTRSYLIQIQGNSTFNKTVTSASVTIEDLTPGNYYTFLVSALVGENNVQGRSIDVSAYTNPGEVKNLSVDQTTTTSVSLKWEPPEGNKSSYLIQIQGNLTFNTSVTSTSVTIEDLTPGNYYTFLVSALVGEINVQGNSTDVSAYTNPGEVKNLSVDQTTTTSVSLKWEPPEGNTSSYLIQIQGNSNFNASVTSTSVTIEDLTPGNYYTFLVSALVGENNVQGNSTDVSAYTKPGEVKNLSVVHTTTSSVSLSWESPEGNTSSYLVQIQGNYTFNNTVTSTSVTIEDLKPGNYYTFLVSALVGENNIQGNSTEISAYTKPGEVTNLRVVQTTTSSVFLKWEPPEGNTSSYLIQIRGNTIVNTTVISTSVTIEDLTPGNYYTFLVSALVGENNVQGNSTDVSGYTKPGEVKNLSVVNTTTSSVSLIWEPPEGNTSSYLVQIQGNSTFNTTVMSTSITIEDLTPGNYYTILVSALVGETNIQGNSTDISAYTKPGEVKNLSVVHTTTTSVSLIWEPPEGNTSSYLIQILGNSAFNTTVTSTSVTIEDLTPGNYYTFLVSAVVGENNIQGNSTDISAYTNLGEVKNLSVVHSTTTSVSLRWDPPEGNTNSYLIQIQGNSTFNTSVTSTSVIIEDLTPGNYYTFLVSAVVGENNIQGNSTEISAYTNPGEVKNLSVVRTTTTSVFLRWDPPEGNANSYLVQIQGNLTFNNTVTSTSVTIEDLIPGNYYTFLVSALVGETNIQGNSTDISDYTIPGEVRNITPVTITTTSVFLIWQPPEGNVDSYVIEIIEIPDFNKTASSPSITITDLIPGNYYTFLVTAQLLDKLGKSVPVSEYTRPANVTIVDVSKVNSSSLNVSWLLSEGNTSSYLVEVLGDPPQSFNVYTESVTITNLTSGNQYTVRISSVAGENDLRGSSSDVLVLLSEIISSTDISTTSIYLVWKPSPVQNYSYIISVYGSPSSNVTVNSTEALISNLVPGNIYRIQISAYSGNIFLNGYGDEITLYTRPGEVKNLSVFNITTSSVSLIWESPEGNTSSYLIQIQGNPFFNTTATSTSVTIEDLTPGNYYTFLVSALVGENNIQGNSTDISAYTKPGEVKNLTVLQTTTSSVSLIWESPEGSTRSYLIQIQGNSTFNKTVPSASVTIEDLTPGNYYTFPVSALVGENNVQGRSIDVSVYTNPGEVKNLSVDQTTTTSVSLKWEPPEGNTSSYLIQIQGNSTFNTSVTSTSVTIEDLTPGNYYTFLVSALVGEINVQGNSTDISAYTKPGEVKNLTVLQTTTSSVSLSWESPEGSTSSYLIQIQGNSTFNTTATSTSVTIEDLTPGNYYTFLVSALVGDNNIQGNSTEISAYTKPGEVKNLSVLQTTTSSVSLIWESPEGNTSSYLIQIQGNPIFNTTVTSTSVTIEDLTPGNYYTFLVSALVGENNVQGRSIDVSVFTNTGEVKNLSVDQTTTTSVSLKWEPPEGNTSSYLIQIQGNSTFNTSVTSTSVTIEDLTPGYYYTFLVSALVGEINVQGNSTDVSAYTKPGEVKNLRVVQTTTSSVFLKWEPPEGNTSSYLIQIQGNPIFNTTATSTSVTIEDLTPGNYYTFLVSALVDENNVQGRSIDVSAYTNPGEVKNLSVDQTTTTSVSLKWEPPEGNTSSYLIQIQGNSTFNTSVTSTSVTIEDLTPGNYYTFLVSALVGENNVQGNSTDVSAYTNPGEVKNLSVDQTTATSVSLKWEPPKGNTSSYLIQIQGNSNFNASVTSTSVTIEDLTPGNYYTFLVSALVGENNVQGNSTDVSAYTKPGEVKNLSVVHTTTSSVSLSWESPEGNTSSYLVQIQGNYTFNNTVTSTSVTIEDLKPGNYYTFLVSALVGENNIQGNSTEISAYTKPGEVKNLRVVQTTTSSVFLKWEPPEGNTSSYLIQIQGNTIVNTTVTSTSVTIEDLTPGNYYTFLVSALVGENNVQGNSTDVSGYTKPGEVKNLSVVNTTTSSVSLIWEPPEGNTSSYLVQIQGNSTFNTTVMSTFITIEDLTPGNYYTILVSALVGETNIQGNSTDISAYTKPGEVKNLSVVHTTTTSVSLIWESPEGNTSSYLIQILGNSAFNTTATSTSVTIEDLTPGNYYTFLVSALVGENNIQGNSTDISAYTIPGEVRNITPVTITTTSVFLIWQPPEGNVDSYVIEIIEIPDFNKTASSPSITITDLIPGNYYTFLVTAQLLDKLGKSVPVSEYTRPANVTIVDVSKVNSSSLNVSWLLSEGNTSSYLVEVLGDPPQSFNVYTESVTITNLTSGNQYTVRISSVAGENDLRGSSSDVLVLLSEIISSTDISTTSIYLVWKPSPVQNYSYIISVYGSPSSNVTVNSTEALISNLVPGNIYRIQISAYSGNIFLNGYGDEITLYTRPGEIKNLSIFNIMTSSVSLSWEPPEGNTSSYLIQIQGNFNFNTTVTSTSVTIEDLTPGNYYTFLVSALVGEMNVQGKSRDISAYTIPGEVKNLSIIYFSSSSISLRWEPPEGNTSSYLIQIQGNTTFNTAVSSTTVTIEDLTPGNYYIFLVSALVGETNVQGNSTEISAYTKPREVKNLTILSIATSSVSLSWEQPDGIAVSYLIQTQGNTTFSISVTSTLITIGDLTPGNYYTFLVSVVGETDVQGNSKAISSYTKPERVTALTVTEVTMTSVNLSWVAPEGNRSSYSIEVLGNSSLSKNVATESATVENLTPGKQYTVIVSAMSGENTLLGEATNINVSTKPGEVKNLTILSIATNSVSLSWEPPGGIAISYLIQIQGNTTFSKSVTSTLITIGDLIPGNYYSFLVSVFGETDVQGNSKAISSYTKPERVTALTVTEVTMTSVNLSWVAPGGYRSSYSIEVLGNSSLSKNVATESATVENLTPGKQYTVMVSAMSGENTLLGEATKINVSTKPREVKNLTILSIATSSVSLSWEQPDGIAVSYLIQTQGNTTFSISVTSTLITIGDLTPGNYYTFLVSVVGETDVQGNSKAISSYTKPERVTALTVTEVTMTSVNLSWVAPEGNRSSYSIEVLGNSSLSKNVATESATVENLTPGKQYTVIVSAMSGENTLLGEATNINVSTKPGEVKNLTILSIATNSVSLSWEPPGGIAISYLIQIQGNTTFSKSVTSTLITIGDLIPGNYYSFLVSVFGETDVQGNSKAISSYTKPERITALTVTEVTMTSVNLSWVAPGGNRSSYSIEVLDNSSLSKNVVTESATVENLTPGKNYTVMVSAMSGENTLLGEATKINVSTKPGEVKNLTIIGIATNSVSLSWEPPGGIAISYLIQIQGNTTFSKSVTSTLITIGDLTPGNYYTFLVSVVGETDVQGNSKAISSYTKPERITALTVTEVTMTSVNLSWVAPGGNRSSYSIEVLDNSSLSKNVVTESATVENLTPGKKYTVMVSAMSGENTLLGEATKINVSTKPGEVKNLTIISIATNSVSLSWEPPGGIAISYLIQIQGNTTFSKSVTSTVITIGDLTPGNYYTFLVSVVGETDVQGNSKAISSYTKPERITALTVTEVTMTSVNLSWVAPGGNRSSYSIEVLDNSSLSKNVVT
ncbi:titin-like, partial [Discoglossus pictus]